MIGNKTKVKIAKNKLAPPFKEAIFDIMYGEGISHVGEILDMAVERNLIQKSGSWFSYQDEKIGQGRDNAKKFLLEHPEIAERLEVKIRQDLGMLPSEEEAERGNADKA